MKLLAASQNIKECSFTFADNHVGVLAKPFIAFHEGEYKILLRLLVDQIIVRTITPFNRANVIHVEVH